MASWRSGITVLGGEAYLSGLASIRERPECLVHAAQLHSEQSGAIDCIVKCFPINRHNRRLINELTGYVIAKACGLPVSPEAFIVLVPLERILEIHDVSMADVAPGGEDTVVAWATRAMSGSPIKVLYDTSDQKVIQRLQRWKNLPRMLAFDDWVGNTDRGTDNLIEVRNGDFALVDHADIAGGGTWLPDLLEPTATVDSRLASMIAVGGRLPRHIASGMVLEAESHPIVFQTIQHELHEWCMRLLPYSQHDAKALQRYLAARASRSADRIRQSAGLLV